MSDSNRLVKAIDLVSLGVPLERKFFFFLSDEDYALLIRATQDSADKKPKHFHSTFSVYDGFPMRKEVNDER